MINTIIWDWNGTLLNDVDICISTMNKMLKKRNLPLLYREKYLEIFDFPVAKYYERLGFDFHTDSFEELSVEFIEHYQNILHKADLFTDVEESLRAFQTNGLKQMVLSAMECKALENSIEALGILHYFDHITGLDNHFATGKEALAKALFEKTNAVPEETIFIGDTIHDLEVANALGAKCILIARGHHSKKRLSATKAIVENSIKNAILTLIN